MSTAMKLSGHAHGQSVDVLHNCCIFHAEDILGVGDAYVWALEHVCHLLAECRVGAHDRKVREASHSHLLGVRGAGDQSHLMFGYAVAAYEVARDREVFARHYALDGRDDGFVGQGCCQRFEECLGEGRGHCHDDGVGIAHYGVNVVGELHAGGVEIHVAQVFAVAALLAHRCQHFGVEDVPCDPHAVLGEDLDYGRSPAAVTDDGTFQLALFHEADA